MTDDSNTELQQGPAVVRGYLYRALNLLARELKRAARDGGGAIGEQEIDKVLEAFRSPDSTVLSAICLAAWDDCGAIFEVEGRGEDRKAPFHRLLVWPFDYLLPERGDRDGAAGTVSRRVIPGYLAAIEDLVGPVLFGRQQERCHELVRSTRAAKGGAFRWEDVYTDRHSQIIIDDILVALAAEFEDFEEQRDWFIGLVNDAMPLPTNGSGHAVALDDDGFKMIMQAIYAHLAQEAGTRDGMNRLLERHGAVAVKQLQSFLEALRES